MRIMAIDYGDAHTGIAISDPTGFLTGTTTTIHSRKAEDCLLYTSKSCRGCSQKHDPYCVFTLFSRFGRGKQRFFAFPTILWR